MKKRKIDGFMAVTAQAPGAWPNGTRVVKIATTDESDRHQPGALATVMGSLANNGLVPEMPHVKYMYCVVWDDMPGMPVFCSSHKLKSVE